MAAAPAKGKDDKKKEVVKKVKGKKSAFYKVEEDKVVRSHKFCPKCGSGVFLANHKDRLSCGKCNYTEWKQKA